MMTDPSDPSPAGWYPVSGGGQRFWDGTRWTPDVLGAPSREAEYAALAPDLPAPGPLAPRPVATAPAGWYPNGSGALQWWDGAAWGQAAPPAPILVLPAKEVGIAYLLLLLLGGFGAHRFYLGRTGSAIAMALLWVFGWMSSWFVIGVPLLIAAGIWAIVDLFLLPSMVREVNAARGYRSV